MSKNAAIAELLQASGLLGDAGTVTEKSKRLASGDNVEVVSGGESQVLEVEEKELKSEGESAAKDEVAEQPPPPNLSIGKLLFAKISGIVGYTLLIIVHCYRGGS